MAYAILTVAVIGSLFSYTADTPSPYFSLAVSSSPLSVTIVMLAKGEEDTGKSDGMVSIAETWPINEAEFQVDVRATLETI